MRLENLTNEIIDRINSIIDQTLEDGYEELPDVEEYTKSGYAFDSYDNANTVTVYDKDGHELNNVSAYITRAVNEKIDFEASLHEAKIRSCWDRITA